MFSSPLLLLSTCLRAAWTSLPGLSYSPVPSFPSSPCPAMLSCQSCRQGPSSHGTHGSQSCFDGISFVLFPTPLVWNLRDLSYLWCVCVCVCVLFAQLYPALCDCIDCSPAGSCVHGILQASILEWLAIPSSRGSSRSRNWTQISCITGRFFTNWATREACTTCYLVQNGTPSGQGELS